MPLDKVTGVLAAVAIDGIEEKKANRMSKFVLMALAWFLLSLVVFVRFEWGCKGLY